MKIREIDIENFGIFTDRHFDFGETPFQLIHGPNEAGKSTLLQLLRQLLFGFPTRSPYQFETHSGEMAARALIDVADGRRISFRRRKGRSSTVVGEVEGTTQKIDEPALNSILSNANIDLYQHVFGFSLSELSRGEESLKHANLNEAMFGGSLGSPSNLQELQKSLENEAVGLFNPKAVKPVVNSLLREIRNRNSEIKEATLKPREFEDKEKAFREAEELVAELSNSREGAEKQRAHLERLCHSVEPWLTRKSVQEELDTIDIPDGITAASGAQLERLQTELRRASASFDAAAKELVETQQNLSELQLAPEFVVAEPQIRSLEKDVSRIKRDLEQAPLLQSQSRTILTQVRSRLCELNSAWDVDYLDTFRSSLEQREKLDELATRSSELEKWRAELAARKPDLQKRVTEATTRLAELVNVQPVTEFDGILEQESAYRATITSLEEATETQASLRSQLTVLRKRLTPVLSNPDLSDDELSELPVPLESLLRDFLDRHKFAETACANAAAKREQVLESLKSRQRELAAKTAEDQAPDRLQLEGQRERRDAGWNLIRRKFLSEFGPETDNSSIDQELENWAGDSTEVLPDLYEREVSETDRQADDRQAKAQFVAICDRLLIEINQLEDSLAEATGERDAHLTKQQEVSREWNALLVSFGARPHPPEVILEWQRSFDTWLEIRTKLTTSQSRLQRLSEQTAEFETLLAAHSIDDSEDSTAESSINQQLAMIRQRSDETKAAALERRQIEKSLPADQNALQSLDKEMSQLDEQQEAWTDEWSNLLAEYGFPADWSVRIASKILQGLYDARQDYEKSQTLAKQAEVLQEDIAQFQEAARKVCLEISPGLCGFPLTDMVSRLSERLSQATQAERDQTSLRRDEQRFTQQLETCQQEVAEFTNAINLLLKAAGISTTDEFQVVAQQALRQQELLAERTALTRDLKRTAGVEDFDLFLRELEDSDTDTLPLKLAEAQRAHREIELRRDEALRLETEARNAWQSMDGISKAAALQLEQEGSYAQLGSAVDRFAPLVLAQTMLKRAVERFEKDHQPAMLAEVGKLLSRMTAGRYIGIRRRLDEAGTMQVEQQNGKLKTPSQLSTGTREQLYLAIRLAYVQHYCHESEPLPLIMDDILVNFDEQRAQNTLEVLFDLPSSIQILFLTCHDHMAKTVEKMRPDLVSIELSRA